MERIQFYPSPDLAAKLKAEAALQKTNLSTLVVDILTSHYDLLGSQKPEAQLFSDVLDEIEAFVRQNPVGTEFDLNTVSSTFNQISMTCGSKPHTLRAKVGKHFASLVGKPGPFEGIEPCLLPNGAPRRTVTNRAAIYRIARK